MTLASFEAALERTDELELTTTGRVTGKPISCPVWFVRRGENLLRGRRHPHIEAYWDGRAYIVP